MVTQSTLSLPTAFHLLAAAEAQSQPLLFRLPPEQQARVIMALLGVVLVGVTLVALALIGGRRLRRIARARPRPAHTNEADWYRKPLVPRDSDREAPPSDSA